MKSEINFLKNICASIFKDDGNKSSVSGFSRKRISAFEEIYEMKFPGSYFEFLEVMGKEASFLNGTHYDLRKLPELKNYAENILLNFNPELKLESKCLVFWVGQSGVFAFFKLGDGDNPSIYGYVNGQIKGHFIEINKNLDGFLNEFINNEKPFKKIEINKSLFPEFFGLQKEQNLVTFKNDNIKYLTKIAKKLIAKNIDKEETKFYSYGDIKRVEEFIKIKFPKSYFEYLRIFGENSPVLKNNKYGLYDLLRMRKLAHQQLLNSTMKLTENDFIFWIDNPFRFAFFRLEDGNNPPIYGFSQGQSSSIFIRISESLDDFLCEIFDRRNPFRKIRLL